MKRHRLIEADITTAIEQIKEKLYDRLLEKGTAAYAGPHETFGIIHEEYCELSDAMRANDAADFKSELIDIAVACIIGMASQLPCDTPQESKDDE